ncbi:hypothetical protein PPROV_000024600 [Pycnococcus provasolii]|uniref:Uncharacterized protein n=1 Tax=Pycnococcus provasolii TaxID=41880 RepID=A0A830H624_9CHLO|nr:hypothetical protein PPROV_000024600 [Pycnococcus provasolii]
MNEAPPPPPHAPPPPPHAPPPWNQRKKIVALKSSSSMQAHAVAVDANLQASAMSQGSSFVKAHAPHAFHSSTAIVGRMHVDGPPSRHDDVVVTLAPATPTHSAGAVNSTADVLDLMQDDDDERYTPVTVTESPAATIPAEPSAGMMVARSFRSFEDARTYVHTLGLKSWKEWQAWSKSGARPHDIPSNPVVTYKSSGWTSLGDFLGYAARSFRSFEEARTYVRTLGLKTKKEWRAWSSSGKRPCDIPSDPNRTYKSFGWLSLGDFLGYAEGKVARLQGGSFHSFEAARAYMRTLGLKSQKEWKAWSSSGKRPHDIPSAPEKAYAELGWLSIDDFLGYAVGKHAKKTKECKFRSFEAAREYVHTLGLKSVEEWEAWRKSGARPPDIPSNPNVTYASSGWTSYGDFLGQGARGSFRSFEDARTYVRTFGMKTKKEWKAWSSSGKRPCDIPSDPNRTYKSSGWLSLGDFLGYAGGKVTGAYKRNAAVAGLRALQNDADNDEKGEQDEDDGDEDARGRKQAKRPRGG